MTMAEATMESNTTDQRGRVDPTEFRGLVVRSPWIERILNGEKVWEIRGSRTEKRGPIALIKSGSGLVYGTVELVDVIGPLTPEEMRTGFDKHTIPLDILAEGMPYKKPYAWVLRGPKMFERPVPYTHPQGAVIWIRFGEEQELSEIFIQAGLSAATEDDGSGAGHEGHSTVTRDGAAMKIPLAQEFLQSVRNGDPGGRQYP
jgi:hypothetical protein